MTSVQPGRRWHKFGRPILALAVAAVFTTAYWSQPPVSEAAFMAPEIPPGVMDEAPYHDSDFVTQTLDLFTHAATLTTLNDGSMMAAWFGGTREGARDVKIYSARYNPVTREWGQNDVLAERDQTEQAVDRMIRKLGNPVLGQAPDGKLWLFYVSVSVGGWAGSAINYMVSEDLGTNWSTPKRLVTSPFFNVSTLVRGNPVFHADGSIGLPVYHESMGKFPEYLRLDRDGRILDKARIDHGRRTLQPDVVALSPTQAIAVLRYAGEPPNRMMISESSASGLQWSEPLVTEIANPNSGLAAIRYDEDEILLALNDLERGRHRLSLFLADNKLRHWRRVKVIEQAPSDGDHLPTDLFREHITAEFLKSDNDSHASRLGDYLAQLDQRMCEEEGCEFKYDYPYLTQSDDGRFHLIYTWNKSMIKHVTFNRAWLEQKQ